MLWRRCKLHLGREVSIYVFCGTLAAKVNLRSAVSSGERPVWPDGFESRKIDVDKVLECYRRYIEFVVEKQPTYKQFVQNMELKMQDPEFLGDTDILLREGTNPFKPQEAYQLVKEQFIDKMPGKRD